MATQELVVQLNPEHYDNLTDANAVGKSNFGKSSCQNNTGTVFAVGSDDNVVIYTSNSSQTKYAISISNPGNSNSKFGFKIAMDSPGDTIIIGAPGDNRVYVFDAQNQARTLWTQRSSGWNNNSYLGTSSSVNYGSDVDVAGDDDSLFVVGRPGDHKIELWSWPNGSSATLLKTITKSSNFGFSCKLSADGQVVIAGGPGNYYPSGTTNAYGNGIAHVYAKDPSSATTWTERTIPFDYTDCPTYVEYIDAASTTIKDVTDTNIESGGTKTPLNPAFGFSVAINRDGTFIAVSAPNRKCFFSAEWVNDTSYNWLTGKPVTGDIDSFGSFLFMQYDGTRIVTGNTYIEDRRYWNSNTSNPNWGDLFESANSYCVLDWNGIYYTNYSESFNLYSFGGVPTSMSRNGEFALFSTKYYNGSFIANENRTTGSNRTLYGGNTVFSFTRFAPTIKILGTATIGGDLKVRFLSVGGDKSYIESNTSAGFVPGYINFENTRDEHSIFRSQIINTSQYTGDDNLSELLLFKSGHVRGLNSRGPDRIRLKSPSIILEGMTSENHPLHTSPDQIGPVAESWSRYLKEASAVYSRLTLTGIGNVGIGIPEYADHIIKENWNLGSSSILGNSEYYKQNENANAQAPPLINHRLVIDGTQSIQNGKLYINNPTSSNLITDGMATCYNTMTSACIQNTNTTNIPYVICDSMKRNPLWSDEDGYNNYYDRMRLYNTVTYDDVNKGLYFGTSTSYASGWTQSTRDTITGNAVNVLSGVYTISYWFMLKDYAQSTFGSNGKLIFTAYHYGSLGYGHKITDTGFKVQYTMGTSNPTYTTAVSDYTVNYTFNQNVWYHVCVKVDNTAGNGVNEGTATTQLWINGVSQSLTANETNRDMNGRFPGFCWFGVVNQASSGTYGHTLGGDGMYGHLIGNVKFYIAHDGTDYFERVAVPDYNTGPDFYNEGPPNEGLSVLGGVNISGGLRANGSSGTSGQVLTSSGGGAMSWTTVSGGGGGSPVWSLNSTNAYYNSGNVGIGTSSPASTLDVNGTVNITDLLISTYIIHKNDTNTYFGFPSDDTFIIKTNGTERLRANSSGNIGIGTASPGYKLDVDGDINMSSGSSLRINGVAQSFGGGGGGSSVWALNSTNAYYNSGNVGIGTSTPAYKLDIAGTTGRDALISSHIDNDIILFDDQKSTTTFTGTFSGGTSRDTTNNYIILASGANSQNRTVSWPIHLPNYWTCEFDWYATTTGADETQFIFYATVPITSVLAVDNSSSTANGFLVVFEFYSGDRIVIKDNSGTIVASSVVTFTSNSYYKVVITFNRGYLSVSMTLNNTILQLNHDFGEMSQAYTTGKYMGFGGRTGGVSSSQRVKDIKVTKGCPFVHQNNNLSYMNGNLGIGKTSPAYTLDVLGNVNITGGLRANGTAGTNGQVLTSSGGGAMSWTTVSGGGGSPVWSLNSTNAYYNSGNVGINTSTPQYKLDVNGDINMSSGSSLRINGVAQSFGGGGGGSSGMTAGTAITQSSGPDIDVTIGGGPYDYMYNQTPYNMGSGSTTFSTINIGTVMTHGQKLIIKLYTDNINCESTIQRGSALTVNINSTSHTVYSNFQDHVLSFPYDNNATPSKFLILEITKENSNQVTVEAKLSTADFTKAKEIQATFNFDGIDTNNYDCAIHNVAHGGLINFYVSLFTLRLAYFGVGHSHDFYFTQNYNPGLTIQASQIQFYYNNSSVSWSQASQTNVYTNFDKNVGMTLSYGKEYRIHHEVIQASSNDYPSKILFTVEEMNAASGGGGGGSYGTGDFSSSVSTGGSKIEINSSFSSATNYNYNSSYITYSDYSFDYINLSHTLPSSLPLEYHVYFRSNNSFSVSSGFKVQINGSQKTTYNNFGSPYNNSSFSIQSSSSYRYEVILKSRDTSHNEWTAEWREYRS